MTKQDILDNPAALSAGELADAVRTGTVTLFELVRTGKLDMSARQALKEALDNPAPVRSTNPKHQPEQSKQTEQPEVRPEPAIVHDTPAKKAHSHDIHVSDKKESWKVKSEPATPIKAKSSKPVQASEPAPKPVHMQPAPDYEPIVNRPMFRHFFSATGRITRSEFAWTYVLFFVYYAAMALISIQLPRRYEIIPAYFLLLYVIIIVLAGIKRCHDMNHSGWWQAIPFYFLWMFFKRGNDEPNRYGLSPYKPVQ